MQPQLTIIIPSGPSRLAPPQDRLPILESNRDSTSTITPPIRYTESPEPIENTADKPERAEETAETIYDSTEWSEDTPEPNNEKNRELNSPIQSFRTDQN